MFFRISVILGILCGAVLLPSAAGATNKSASCPAAEVRVATTPIPPQRSWALNRFEKHQENAEINADVVVVGDSIVERWPNEYLAQVFPGADIANLGLGSDRTQTTLWRLARVQVGDVSPRKALILLGTNQLSEVNDVCGISAGVEAVVNQLSEKWPSLDHIFILGVLPRGASFSDFKEKIVHLNSSLSELASHSSEMTYIKPPEGLSCKEQSGEDSIIPDFLRWFWASEHCSYFLNDNLHLSADGYALLSAYLSEQSTAPKQDPVRP